MKRGCPSHPKMHRLARLAGIRHRDAVAIVELLHHWCTKYAMRGDAGRHDDAEIAAAVEWLPTDGEPSKIVDALVASGWLDRDPVHRLLVHDWPEHCDSFVHMALARAKQTFASGEIPKRARIGGEERKQLDLFWHAFEQKRIAPTPEPQQELLSEDPIRAHAVRTPCALPPPPPPPSPPPDPERESDARARDALGFGPSEETPAPEELGEGERTAIRLWARTFAPSRLSELIQLEQTCLAYARKHGRSSFDWVNEVKLWILRQASFEKSPQRARPPEEDRAVSRERSDRAEVDARRRRNQLDEWKREKDEAEPESISEAREEFRSRMLKHRGSSISLDAWVDRKAASG